MSDGSPILSLIYAIDSLAEELRLINLTLREVMDRADEEDGDDEE